MIGRETVQTIRDTIAAHEPPVLSLYLDVNPANPANVRKAHLRRAKEALKELDLPKALADEVLRRLNLDHVIAQGRTLVIFAGEDPDELFESYYFQTDLPLLEITDGALGHWGAPYVAPILFALDEQERHALIYVGQEEWRCFQVFLGEIEEVASGSADTDAEAWPRYTEARRSPALTGPVRGGSSHDRFRDRQEVRTLRMYRRAARRLEQEVHEEGIDRIILLGQTAQLGDFEALLPRALQNKVVARLPAPADPAAPAHEWLALVAPELEQIERDHEEALLARIRERGLWGYEETLAALQEYRLSMLLIPWGLGAKVYRCDESGLVAPALAWAEKLCPQESYQFVPLKEILPELVERYGIKLEILHGEPAEQLKEDFGGLAAVRRW